MTHLNPNPPAHLECRKHPSRDFKRKDATRLCLQMIKSHCDKIYFSPIFSKIYNFHSGPKYQSHIFLYSPCKLIFYQTDPVDSKNYTGSLMLFYLYPVGMHSGSHLYLIIKSKAIPSCTTAHLIGEHGYWSFQISLSKTFFLLRVPT